MNKSIIIAGVPRAGKSSFFRTGCENHVEQSGLMEEQGARFGLSYVETSGNRIGVFNRILQGISDDAG